MISVQPLGDLPDHDRRPGRSRRPSAGAGRTRRPTPSSPDPGRPGPSPGRCNRRPPPAGSPARSAASGRRRSTTRTARCPAGSRFRLEPVAMTACWKSTPLTSPPSSARLVDEVNRAWPRSTVTPRRLSSPRMPSLSPCTMPSVQARSLTGSMRTLSKCRPNSAARRAVSWISTVWISALDGMQPFEQAGAAGTFAALDQQHVLAQIGQTQRRDVAAGAAADDDDLGLFAQASHHHRRSPCGLTSRAAAGSGSDSWRASSPTKRAASAPSATRWSKASVSGRILRMTICPSRTTGFSCTRPMPRMATSG